ncbi:unnamed protein product [Didymodactylos carnosus]|uniref:FAD-binding domain-containing protein n=1 Tax=Didymodactylos carnosus TaxID=1234261 RepID=A0A815SRT7_9BILA|nr:unnamed protein product [Didymodactylos carnosus]CAF1495300.1 unnamed protein product [Didymodactylos carnosus]CAF3834428.1 unnamed protein product [Didymodactylos carnosus]CAF4357844.1 unnamed protein product [Didymodactylos carnosus]
MIEIYCTNVYDGTRYDCGMCIGADDLWSQTRKFVHDDREPINLGYVAYRGSVPIEQVLEKADRENVLFYVRSEMHLFNVLCVYRRAGAEEELNECFGSASCCAPARNALPQLKTNFHWSVYYREPLSEWSRGRLVSLGDAAHSMLPYAAPGVAQALEDAATLVAAYSKYGAKDILSLFKTYEQERIPRSARVAQFNALKVLYLLSI